MPGQYSRGQIKPQAEGATAGGAPQRGCQSPRMMMVGEVKREEGGGEAVTSHSLQRLRRAILGRREEAGLEEILVDFPEAAKHELTPEELEKRERRKEQNRRAARKCRQKKRLQQTSVAQKFSMLMAVNQAKEDEVNQLREELAHLMSIVEQHNRSGQCYLLPLSSKAENPSDVMPTSPATVRSPVMSWEESTPPVEDASVSEVQLERYLQDLGPLLPDSTFTDLETFMNLDHFDCPSPLLSGSPQQQQQKQQHQQQQSLQPLTPPSGPMLKSLEHSDLHACHHHNQSMLCPVSPCTNQVRLSLSSTASDWSVHSYQSQGFCVLSAGEWEGQPQGLGMVVPDYEVEDGENDDVFVSW